jgi:monofunctional biosynthetic peptidoglycan transglycosylase
VIQIKKATKENKWRKRPRGASTISQQTAKNVFLWPKSSWFRKGLEVYFTLLIEVFWTKDRILEVYLNCMETGKACMEPRPWPINTSTRQPPG